MNIGRFWAAIALLGACGLGPGIASAQQSQATQPPAPVVESKFANVNGARLHYLLQAGQGDPVVLLHGFGQSSQMWRPLMRELAKDHTVVAVDLRGAGQSDAPEEGYAKSAMAGDVHELMRLLGYDKVSVVGHDIGSMVAYAYAAQFPNEVKRIALLDAPFLPGVGDWTKIWLDRNQWHFQFFGKTPQALVQGRERIYLEHFWDDSAADPAKSISEADRKIYATEYARPNHVRAGMEWFRTLEQDGKQFHEYAAKPVRVPLFVLTGEKGAGDFLIKQVQLIATDVQSATVPGAGHWLMEEAPGFVIPKLVDFLGQPAANPETQSRH
jgi:pimeloyl-ACP methyl ester carboxylesterase